MKSKQNGYTLVELIICIGFFTTLVAAGGLVWVAIHFISKLW